MTQSLALDFDTDKFSAESTIVRTGEEDSGDDVKYEWNLGLEGGRPPFDAVIKGSNGTILDSKWNFTSDTTSGEFYASSNLESIVIEVVDESNQHVSKTFHV